MGKRSGVTICLAGLLALVSGCKRQDTESLGRIGRKVLDRAHVATAGFQEKLSGLKGNLGLHERVSHRLRWDKALAELTVEVNGTGAEVELKGIVKTADQKRRAVELAETTAGVERVSDSLQVQGD